MNYFVIINVRRKRAIGNLALFIMVVIRTLNVVPHVPLFLYLFCLFCVSYELGWCLVIGLRIL